MAHERQRSSAGLVHRRVGHSLEMLQSLGVDRKECFESRNGRMRSQCAGRLKLQHVSNLSTSLKDLCLGRQHHLVSRHFAAVFDSSLDKKVYNSDKIHLPRKEGVET